VGNDQLFGGDGRDFMSGGNDNAYLEDQLGNDTLNGGGGNDYLKGQLGDVTPWMVSMATTSSWAKMAMIFCLAKPEMTP
jgi:hypothetical protein